MTDISPTLAQFQKLVELVSTLRGPSGCPWDKSQTAESLTFYIIEEAFELTEAIDSGLASDIKDELGDFLFQVILQSQIASESSKFSLDEVLENLNSKLIRRHPHVFSPSQNGSSAKIEEVWKVWEQTKKEEQAKKNLKPSLFKYPKNLPSLQAAHKIGTKSKTLHFDWKTHQEVLEKLDEEILELKEALRNPENTTEIESEIGDCLFTLSQLARHLNLDAEAALRKTNARFQSRFEVMLQWTSSSAEKFATLSDSEKQDLWERAKIQHSQKNFNPA